LADHLRRLECVPVHSWRARYPLHWMLDFRKGKIEGGALIDRAFGSHRPAVAMNDTLNGCQSYSSALKLVSAMQPLNYAEQLVHMLHLKSDAVVPHKDFRRICVSIDRADLDFGGASRA